MSDSPVFIHSLFRAGSTYVFKVFRRSERGYWCYQEPLHELAVFNRDHPRGLQQDHGEAKAQLLRHPPMDAPYFTELQEVWPAWRDAISEPIIYDAYFAGRGEDIGIPYWQALAKAARGRPVFQECRTSGRIGAIKNQMGGRHIYLWRNPWDQWWSYKVAPYFDIATQLIIQARHAPAPVERLLAEFDFPAYRGRGLAGAMVFYGEKPLTSDQSYLGFYLLWCLALREAMTHADIMISVDRLSDSVAYQSEMQAALQDSGIDDIDFSDCRVPQGRYLRQERDYFCVLEGRVHQWLSEGGWAQPDIDQIQTLRQRYEPASWNAPIANLPASDLAEQASRARALATRLETTMAKRARHDAIQVSEIEAKAEQAEAQMQRAESREAEARAELATRNGEIERLHAEIASLHVQITWLQRGWDGVKADLSQTQAQLAAMYASTSWRVMAPLRGIAIGARHLKAFPAQAKVAVKIRLKPPMVRLGAYLSHRPVLKSQLLRVLRRFPRLEARLIRAALPAAPQGQVPNPDSAPKASEQPLPPGLRGSGDLTESARLIYEDLLAACAAARANRTGQP